ncbi:PP-loop family protein, putative [Plasmodium yoelii]|uniref:PP-loop family protein n=2 Tax=Plasmodium yoelii TaxID=5861 RepID=A0AAF0AZ22_PLAYO|nr:PP-loop family protein, putative [Plasmodium yoelii]WBY56022.1 PP-loop family protein [Plasmodium yoelii yoelii]CDU17004.1 conserved Plasmodium protein, unknown function [Plasmodium yoelii]VTZ75382.1 PP-loop family protein, putative [Plasmodium yoelii]|eukprot:XP_725240.3 PP-loop family protein, putative [Plasmodium yoelii]
MRLTPILLIFSILSICWNYVKSLKIRKNGNKIYTFLNPGILKKITNHKHHVYLKTEKNIHELIFNKGEKLLKDILKKKKKKKIITINGNNKEQNKVTNLFKEWKTHNEIFLKKFCSFINIENDIKNKELENITKYNSLLFTKWEKPKDVFNIYSNTYKDYKIKEKNNLIDEAIQQVEIYWASLLINRYFFYFLKKDKYIIFSVSGGVDSLSLLYSFIFTIYKIIIILLYKDHLNYLDILDKIKNVYFYKDEDIYNLVHEKIANASHVGNDSSSSSSEPLWKNKVQFFLNILNKITVLYCDHQTRIECAHEKKFLKHICKLYNLKFATKVLTKRNIIKAKGQSTVGRSTSGRTTSGTNRLNKTKLQNNFLLISRLWRRNAYIEVTNKIYNEKIKDLRNLNEDKNGNDPICDFENGKNYKYSEYLNDINIYLKKVYKKNVCNVLLKNYKKIPNYFSNFFFKKNEFIKNSKKIKSLIFIGHHQNDNNETILFHFFRGIYIKNLKGINFLTYFKNCLLYRPFIKLNKIHIYNYMYAIQKKWKYDISNQKLHSSRNFIRNILIPTISLIFKKDKEKNEQGEVENAKNEEGELENANIYAHSSLNKRLTNLLSQIKNIDKHLEFHNNIFYIYLKNKYYISDDIKNKTNNFFITEYIKMQNNLYKHFFFNINVNNIIQINKLLYKNNIFLKIFNFYEFLTLPSKLTRIQILYNIIKSNIQMNLNYSLIDQIYNELYLFTTNNLRNKHFQKRIACNHLSVSSNAENEANKAESETDYKKIKIININGKNKIVVNKNLFCIVNNHIGEASNGIEEYKDKNSNIFIHDNISAKIKRINKKSFDIEKNKTKNAYLFIKKRKKKKNEKFNIHIRYLKKNDFIINDKQKNKYIKAIKFLLKHNIPYIYKYFLPIVEITNFRKSGILFFFLFGKLTNDKFALRYSIKKKKLQNYFIYSIKFKNNHDSFT